MDRQGFFVSRGELATLQSRSASGPVSCQRLVPRDFHGRLPRETFAGDFHQAVEHHPFVASWRRWGAASVVARRRSCRGLRSTLWWGGWRVEGQGRAEPDLLAEASEVPRGAVGDCGQAVESPRWVKSARPGGLDWPVASLTARERDGLPDCRACALSPRSRSAVACHSRVCAWGGALDRLWGISGVSLPSPAHSFPLC